MNGYYEKPYDTQFTAEVLSCNPYKSNLFAVELSYTLFYPRGGGQPGDRGSLISEKGVSQVVDTISDNGVVLHLVDSELCGTIQGELDWVFRYDFMQQHTAQHLLSGLLYAHGFGTVSVSLSDEYLSIEVDSSYITEDTITAIENEFAHMVAKNLAVTPSFVEEGASELQNLRRPLKHSGSVRIVTIGDSLHPFDSVGCGGVHTATTGELGFALFIKSESIRQGLRLFWLAGDRVLSRYRRDMKTLLSLGKQLSVPADDILVAFEQDRTQRKLEQQQILELQTEVISLRVEERKRDLCTISLIEEIGRTKTYIKDLVKGLQNCSQGTLLIEGNDSVVGWYLIMPENFQISPEFRSQVLQITQGKGGGSGRLLQGRGVLSEVPKLFDFLKQEIGE